jgi:HSP20 family protein
MGIKGVKVLAASLARVVEAELPGVDEKDVSVTLANGVLTIKGEKKQETEEKGENYYRSERSFGSFERSIPLPDTIDDAKAEAKFDKGVLRVTAAKKPEACNSTVADPVDSAFRRARVPMSNLPPHLQNLNYRIEGGGSSTGHPL